MAEALLRRRLLDVGALPRVHSAGLRADGLEVSKGAVTAVSYVAAIALCKRKHLTPELTGAARIELPDLQR